MTPRKKKDNGIPPLEDLPKKLRMAIVRLMARRDIDYREALKVAATLLDINSRIFEEKVNTEAEKRYRSRFMIQLNKARSTIEKKYKGWADAAHERVFNDGYQKGKDDYGVWYNCVHCREPMYVTPNSDSHRAMAQYMREHGWGHKSCHDKAKGTA